MIESLSDIDGTSKKSMGLLYVEGNSEDTAGTWTASCPEITSYYVGLTIAYKVAVAGASPTTLNINGLGAVTVVRQATTSVSTNYPVNTVVVLIYTEDGDTAYWKTGDYDANTDTKVRQYQVTNNTAYALLTRYNTTDKAGTYDATYARYDLKATLNHSTGIIKSTQDYVTTNANFPLLFSGTSGVSSTADRELANDALCNTVYANPSTGSIYATKLYKGTDELSVKKSAQITVPASGGAVTVTGMTATADVIVSPDPASFDVYTTAGCRCTAQASNSLTFTVSKTATASMTVNVVWFV